MKRNNKWLLFMFLITLSAVFLLSSGGAIAAIDGGYVGSAVCGTCHGSIKADFDKSGHPYKVRFTDGLTPVTSGAGAGEINDPLSALLTPVMPNCSDLLDVNGEDHCTGSNLSWSDVSYVIGGWGWKARWGAKDTTDDSVTGYVWSSSVSSPTGAQYNLFTGTYSSYGSTAKKYQCAICHNTNGTSSADAGCTTPLGSGRTEPWASTGLTPASHGGFYSEWTFSGVQCEACHGPGETHAGSPSSSNIIKNTSAEVCGKCHIRATNTSGFGGECGGDASPAILTNGAITAAGGFGSHHEQYNEMVGYNGDGVHASLDCVTCHDPHKRTHKVPAGTATALGITDNNDSPETRGAIRKSCSDCHWAQDSDGAANIPDHTALACQDCHMAEATKSATNSPTTGWGRKADVKSHIVKIDPTQTENTRTNADAKTIATNYLTVAYACGKCHDTAIRAGASANVDELSEAQTAAANYHNVAALTTPVDGGYVGSEICSTCHVTKYDDFKKSGHPYKYRHTGGANPPTDPLSALLIGTTPLASSIDTSTLGDAACGNGLIVCDADDRLDWSAINYVIGGYGWKARWGMKDFGQNPLTNPAGDQTGYVWTGTTQFNMLAADPALDPSDAREDWSGYNANKDKKYECSTCHSTNGRILTAGYDCVQTTTYVAGVNEPEPWASNPGMDPTTNYGGYYSEWSLDGVQCEACHGPAATHVSTRLAADIVKDSSKDICGACHMRAENTPKSGLVSNAECGGPNAGPDTAKYLANGAKTGGGWISHHEQYNEMVGTSAEPGVHASLDCVSCHNPHKRSHKVTDAVAGALGITDNDQTAEARGAVVSCQSCHGSKDDVGTLGKTHLDNGLQCITCHMAEATKSATAETGALYGKSGDVKTHIFKINVDPTAADTTDPNNKNSDNVSVAHNYLTLNYACGKCHDSTMSSFVGIALTKADLASFANGIHSVGGSTASGARFNWYHGGCYEVNFDGSMNGGSCSWDFGGPGAVSGGSGCVVSYTYDAAGSYLVTLTVDGTSSRTMVVTAKGNSAVPTTAMTVGNCASGSVDCGSAEDATGMTVLLTDKSSANSCGSSTSGIATVLWGDGTTTLSSITAGGDTGTDVGTHKYGVAGTYTIRYSFKDSNGNKSMADPATVTVPDVASAVCDVTGTVIGTTILQNTLITLKKGSTVVKQASTKSDGTYTLKDVQAGAAYTIIPSRNGYSFLPADTNVHDPYPFTLNCDSTTGNSTGHDFEATAEW